MWGGEGAREALLSPAASFASAELPQPSLLQAAACEPGDDDVPRTPTPAASGGDTAPAAVPPLQHDVPVEVAAAVLEAPVEAAAAAAGPVEAAATPVEADPEVDSATPPAEGGEAAVVADGLTSVPTPAAESQAAP